MTQRLDFPESMWGRRHAQCFGKGGVYEMLYDSCIESSSGHNTRLRA